VPHRQSLSPKRHALGRVCQGVCDEQEGERESVTRPSHEQGNGEQTESAVVPMEVYLDAALQLARARRQDAAAAQAALMPQHVDASMPQHVLYISSDDPEVFLHHQARSDGDICLCLLVSVDGKRLVYSQDDGTMMTR